MTIEQLEELKEWYLPFMREIDDLIEAEIDRQRVAFNDYKAYNDGFLDGSKELADRVNPCLWCDGNDHEIAYMGDTESIWMEGNKLSAYGDGEAVCYIGYCPNCGRKLEGERHNLGWIVK